jgi:hypothetical protein
MVSQPHCERRPVRNQDGVETAQHHIRQSRSSLYRIGKARHRAAKAARPAIRAPDMANVGAAALGLPPLVKDAIKGRSALSAGMSQRAPAPSGKSGMIRLTAN